MSLLSHPVDWLFNIWSNKESFGMCNTRIRDIEKKIEWYQSLFLTEDNMNKKMQLQEELNEWRNRQEILWSQKSRELWLMAGDRNFKFFHALTVTNRRRIFIATIRNNKGEWLESMEQIGKYLCDEFTNLLKFKTIVHC